MNMETVDYFWHVVIGPSLLFVLGALANYAYSWLKQKAQKEKLFLSPDETNCLVQAMQQKCSLLFVSPEDLEKMHRTIMDEIYNKFATREVVRKIEDTLSTMHDDSKADMKEIKDQLTFITQYLMEHKHA